MSSPFGGDRFGSGIAGIALAYAGGAWVLIQVVESLDSLLELPDPLVRGALVLLLIGFPIVLTTAWVQRRVRQGRADRDGMSGLLTWRNALLGGVGVFAAWGAVAAVWLGVRTDPRLLDPADDGPRVLAVLPFDNLLPDGGEREWLVAGLHEQVIHELTRLPGLRVISRTSVLPYRGMDLPVPQIAEALGADVILEGSVRGDAGTVRATLQLIDARTDHHEWSAEYDADVEDLLEAQTSIARRVAATFADTGPAAGAPAAGRPTASDEALQAYLRGRYVYNTPDPAALAGAIERYREALDLDPDFALAWAALAEAWLTSAHFGTPPHEAFPRADSAAVQALARDPQLAEAHIALADTRFHYDWNWEGAERGFRRGLSLNPSHSTGLWFLAGLLAARGRGEEAAGRLVEARALDPTAPIVHAFGARVRYWDRAFDDAREGVDAALSLDPDFAYAHGVQGFVHLAEGRPDEAVSSFRRATEATPKFLPGLAMALARAGAVDEARAIADSLEALASTRYVPPYERSFAWVGLGEHDKALDLLEEATGTRDAELIWIAVEPALDPLREEPRFQEVLRRMGLEGVGGG